MRDYLRLNPAAIPVPQAQRTLNELVAKEQAELQELAGKSPLKVPGVIQP